MTPIARYQTLQAELNPIQDKHTHDNKWFEVGSDKKLFLRERPYVDPRQDYLLEGRFFAKLWNCLCRVKECLRRLFSNPYPILEKKIVDLSTEINDYLKVEDDSQRRSQFLDQYGPAVSQLIAAAKTLQLTIPPEKIAPSSRIHQWMLANMPYLQTNLFLTAKNLNPKRPVTFDFKHGISGSYGWEKEFSKPLSVKDEPIQQRVEKDWKVSAKFTHKDSVVLDPSHKSLRIVIGADGEISHHSANSEGVISIRNESQFNLSVVLKGFTDEENTSEMHSQHLDISAGETVATFHFPITFSPEEKTSAAWCRNQAENNPYKKLVAPALLPPKADGVLHRVEYDIKGVQVKPMKFGCKSGQYTATLGPDGKLNVDVKAHRVFEKTLPATVVKKDEILQYIHSPENVSTEVLPMKRQIGPALKVENVSESLLELDVTVRTTIDANQPFAPQFTVSNFMVKGHQTRVSDYAYLKKQAKGTFNEMGAGAIEDQDQAEFNITVRELATQ